VSAGGVDWRAVGIGAAVGIGGSLLLGVLMRLVPFDFERHGMWTYQLLTYGAGGLVDLACGATAGALAGRRGALHGLLAGAITAVVSPLLGLAMFFVTTRFAVPLDVLPWLLAVATGALLGIVLATLAGAVAARLAPRRAD
jgi:hypothetical protein